MASRWRRAVVTGLGAVTPLGNTVRELWDALLAGRSGISLITLYDCSKHSVQIAGEVKNFDPARHGLDGREARRMDRFSQFAVAAANEAVADSGLDFSKMDTARVGVVVGTGIGGLQEIEEQKARMMAKGPGRVSPFLVPKLMANAASGQVSIIHRLGGPNICVVTACAAGANSLGSALRMIQHEEAEVMVAGGAEAAITGLGMAGFWNMGALSGRNSDPAGASRPFDKERDGFVMGEGAGILVLEELEHARRRGARIYCEFSGYGASGDGFHLTAPPENGEGGARAMAAALRDAGLNPEDLDYINSHGTATVVNDKVETTAIKSVFGARAFKLAVNSTKSMLGHLLGAAGGVEAVVTVLSLAHDRVHQTLNWTTRDPDCDLDYVPNAARELPVRHALSNSLGFGGHNATLAFSKFAG